MKRGIYLGYTDNNKIKNALEFEGNFYLIKDKNKSYKSFDEARKDRDTKNPQNCWIISIDDNETIICVEDAFK